MPNINWDENINKHRVRVNGWLPHTQNFIAGVKSNRKTIKYLTLCDIQAIDIFMLEKGGLLPRNTEKKLDNVTIVESDNNKITQISDVIRPPSQESIILGEIQKLLLFEDREEYQTLSPDTYIRNINRRREFQIRESALKLQQRFPFDIINFDPWSSLFNANNELHRGFKELFNLQQGHDSFLLFITSTANEDNVSRLEEAFANDFEENVNNHPEIKNKAEESLGTCKLEDINDLNKKVHIGFNKSIIAKYASEYNWKANFLGTYFYENKDYRQNISLVVQLDKNDESQNDWYIEQIQGLITSSPTFFSYEDSLKDEQTKEDLQSIIQYRDDLQREFRE